MAELHVDTIPCFLQDDIQGEVIPERPTNFPFSTEFLDELTDNFPVLIGTTNSGKEGTINITSPEADTRLRSLSHHHGRSFEVFVGEPEASETALGLWGDEYGNRFTSLSTKGNNFSRNYILRSLSAPSGYMPYGLQETDSILRVVRASRLLRESGVDTEMIVRMVEPEHFIWSNRDESDTSDTPVADREMVTLPEMKRRLLLDYWENISKEKNAMEQFQEVTTAIEAMSFFITLRATGIGTRLDDFFGEPEECRKQVKKTFSILNMQLDRFAPEQETPLDSERYEDVEYYFTGLLPRLIGKNIALIHELGLVHNFPSTGNTTQIGGIVDLDGVQGPLLGLGDEAPTSAQYVEDLVYYDDPDKPGNYLRSIIIDMLTAYGRSVSVENLISWEVTFTANLIDSYLQTRFHTPLAEMSAEEIDLSIDIASGVYDRTGYLMTKRLLGDYVDELFTSIDGLPSMPEADVQGAVEPINSWIESKLNQGANQMLINMINDRTYLQLSQEGTFAQIRTGITKNIKELVDVELLESLHTLLENESFQSVISDWIDEKITDGSCSVPPNMNKQQVRAILTHIIFEKVHQTDPVSSITTRVFDSLDENFARWQMHSTTILKDPDEHIDEAVRVVLDGQLHAWYSPLSKETFIDSLNETGNEDIRLSVRVSSSLHQGIRTSADQLLREIYSDRDAHTFSAHVQRQEDEAVFKSAEIRSDELMGEEYVAWLVEDAETGQKTLHVRVADKKLKKYFKTKLAEKRFNKRFTSMVDEITQQYLGNASVLATMAEMQSPE